MARIKIEDLPGGKKMSNKDKRRVKGGKKLGDSFVVFKESIRTTSQDQNYWLNQLARMNAQAEALGDYLKYLSSKT